MLIMDECAACTARFDSARIDPVTLTIRNMLYQLSDSDCPTTKFISNTSKNRGGKVSWSRTSTGSVHCDMLRTCIRSVDCDMKRTCTGIVVYDMLRTCTGSVDCDIISRVGFRFGSLSCNRDLGSVGNLFVTNINTKWASLDVLLVSEYLALIRSHFLWSKRSYS